MNEVDCTLVHTFICRLCHVCGALQGVEVNLMCRSRTWQSQIEFVSLIKTLLHSPNGMVRSATVLATFIRGKFQILCSICYSALLSGEALLYLEGCLQSHSCRCALQVDITDVRQGQGGQEKYHEAVEKSRAGWLQLEGDMLSFASSLHREFYAFNLCGWDVYPSVDEMPGTLQEFLSMAICRMQWRPLSRSKSASFHDRAVHEAHYQHQLYR